MRALLSLCTAAATTLLAPAALADATGWAQLGGGALAWQTGDEGELTVSPTMTIDMGIGTTPEYDFVFGGLFRIMPVFVEGADLGLLFRFAPSGFQSDAIGFAIDAGGYLRTWSPADVPADDISAGFTGDVILGLPLGFEIGALGMVGSGSTYGFGGFAGIDFLRLTMYRDHLTDWWLNPGVRSRDTAAE